MDTYPNFNALALDILKDRYLWKDDKGNLKETPVGLLVRVASTIAAAEEDSKNREYYAHVFYNMMARLDFLPNSPTLMNAGRPAPHGQLAACFVIGVEDSMEGICAALRKQMLIHKTGGGTGFNFSNLRPKNSQVHSTNGRASGPVSFMRLFDLSTEVVQQGGMRRGANMAILNADHPDIEDFILSKDEDGKIANFNLSVGITDEFMNKALDQPYGKEADLLDLIAVHAYMSGDPGVVFLDALNRDNPCPQLGKITATNPCVTGDTKILTDKGYRRIDECVGKTVNVWNGETFSEVIPKVTGENQPVMRVAFSDGAELYCTPYHKFHIQKGFSKGGTEIIKEAKDLAIGDALIKTKYPIIYTVKQSMNKDEYYLNGFFTGDGSEYASGKKVLPLYGEKKKLAPFFSAFGTASEEQKNRITVYVTKYCQLRDKFWIPVDEHVQGRLSWLAGFIDSDGHRNSKEGSVAITSIHRDFLDEVRLMLNTLGVHASVLPLKDACEKLMPDGKGGQKAYKCKKSYRLIISASEIAALVDLGLQTKRVDLSDITPNRNAGRFVKVVEIEDANFTKLTADKVYCFTEHQRHTGMFNGILTGNCGESPLLDNEACNLGSINLSNFYDTENDKIDYSRLMNVVWDAVRFLDNVIDAGQYPLPEIETAVKRTRKIGLGVMGFADLLFKMHVPYDSPQARLIAGGIMNFIQRNAVAASEAYGKEKGIPSACHHLNRRNATVTCIAPTGTLALLAGCSSGIEPVFSLSHARTITTVDGGKHTVDIFHPVYAELSKDMRITPSQLKRICVTAYNIAPLDHVKMQAVFQQYTDLAVSKTVNLPNEATVDDVLNVYIEAWKLGCKGTTVYRDGSKGTQVLTLKDGELPQPKCTTC